MVPLPHHPQVSGDYSGEHSLPPEVMKRQPTGAVQASWSQDFIHHPAVSRPTPCSVLRDHRQSTKKESVVWAEGSSHCCHVITEAPLLPPRVSKKTQLENLGFQPQPTRDLNKIQGLIKYSKIKWKITCHQEPGKSQLE